MIFDLDKHKVRVATEVVLSAAVGGAALGITSTFVDPNDFNPLDPLSWKRLGAVALVGAVLSVLNLIRSLPRNPIAGERRTDRVQVAVQAEKLGIVDPGTANAVKHEEAVKQAEAVLPEKKL